MTTMGEVFLYSSLGLLSGYILGRIGHYYVNDWIGNPSWVPHHWIYGAMLVPVGSYFIPSFWALIIMFFGVGHFISDFKDFLELKFFSPDDDGPKRFFHID